VLLAAEGVGHIRCRPSSGTDVSSCDTTRLIAPGDSCTRVGDLVASAATHSECRASTLMSIRLTINASHTGKNSLETTDGSSDVSNHNGTVVTSWTPATRLPSWRHLVGIGSLTMVASSVDLSSAEAATRPIAR
jgi:hypothetical protein